MRRDSSVSVKKVRVGGVRLARLARPWARKGRDHFLICFSILEYPVPHPNREVKPTDLTTTTFACGIRPDAPTRRRRKPNSTFAQPDRKARVKLAQRTPVPRPSAP